MLTSVCVYHISTSDYWPHFTGVTAPRTDELGPRDIALFTMSKVTGHAGTRIGWALTKDDAVAERLRAYVQVNGALPRENQARALKIFNHILDSDGEILREAREEMTRRWDGIQKVFSGSSCHEVMDLGPKRYDVWTDELATPTPAYLWLKCRGLAAEERCYDRLLSFGVKGVPGASYGDVTDEHARVELLMRAPTWDLILERLKLMEQAGCS